MHHLEECSNELVGEKILEGSTTCLHNRIPADEDSTIDRLCFLESEGLVLHSVKFIPSPRLQKVTQFQQ
jgi:hypothetical protein